MHTEPSGIDKQIKKQLEVIYILNKQWMQKEQYASFIDYKLYRENNGDVISDSQFLLENIDDISDRKILDVGCGTGDIVIRLLIKKSGLKISGIDLSENDIKIAQLKSQKYGIDPLIFQVQNGSKLPFPDESFDLVLCVEVLEHTERFYMDVLKEIFRVLKPNGLFYLTIPNKLCPYDTHLYTWFPHWLPKKIRIPYLNLIRGEKAKAETYLLNYNFFTSREIGNILKPFTQSIFINEKNLRHKFNSIKINNDDATIKKLIKNIFKICNQIRPVNLFLIKFLAIFYFFQSIKILAEKKGSTTSFG